MEAPPTAALADACIRLGLPVRTLGLRPAWTDGKGGPTAAGPAIPARHAGSVDVFLEALQAAPRGGVLVVDNGGRLDEACVGDLTALECRHRGAAGMAVWGAHRDTAELAGMAFAAWSLGAIPTGPQRLEPRHADALASAFLGPHRIEKGDIVACDADGAAVVAAADWPRVEALARKIVATERAQADKVRSGMGLAEQLDLAGFVAARAAEPGLSFRTHLRKRGGAIEE